MSVYLGQSPTWQALRPWQGHAYLPALAGHAQEALPEIWEEFEGLAEGLRLPAAALLLWHCRRDLLHKTTHARTSVTLLTSDGNRRPATHEHSAPPRQRRCSYVHIHP